MDQYNKDTKIVKLDTKDTANEQDLKQQIVKLKIELEAQQATVSKFEKDLKKLKNDLRVAINTFNSKHG